MPFLTPSVVVEGMDNAMYHTACNNSKDEALAKDRGASAKPRASYVTTASQASRFGIRSEHSGKQERDHPCDPHNYLAHINLPTAQKPSDEISAKCHKIAKPSPATMPRTHIRTGVLSVLSG